MSDIIDIANDRVQTDLALFIQNALRNEALPYTGYCHNCDAILDPTHRFCDASCRDDYERRQQSIRRNRDA